MDVNNCGVKNNSRSWEYGYILTGPIYHIIVNFFQIQSNVEQFFGIAYSPVDIPLALAGAVALGFSALPSFFAFFSFGFPNWLASFCSTVSDMLTTGCGCSVVNAALASLDSGLFLGNGIALAATKIHQS